MILFITLAWTAILMGSWLGWQLLRQNGRLLLRLEELERYLDELELGQGEEQEALPVGSDAPRFDLPDLAGDRKSLDQYRGQPLLLIFFNPACGFCRDLVPKLEGKAENGKQKAEMGQSVAGNGNLGEPPKVLIVSTGDATSHRTLFDRHKNECPVLLQKEMEVTAAYRAEGTPSGYLISAEGRIASPLAKGADALLKLFEGKGESGKQKTEMEPARLRTAPNGNEGPRAGRFSKRSLAGSKIKRDGLKVGTTAPDFRLPRLDGRGDLNLSDLRGKHVLLVFSSPHCGPCSALAPHLENFHREHADMAVVMISKGEPKENRAKVKKHGLTFPVVLQQQWEISRRYAMFATPVAYLVNEAGMITRDVAVGTDPILTLLSEAARDAEYAAPTRL